LFLLYYNHISGKLVIDLLAIITIGLGFKVTFFPRMVNRYFQKVSPLLVSKICGIIAHMEYCALIVAVPITAVFVTHALLWIVGVIRKNL
jgi:hypothetical protein